MLRKRNTWTLYWIIQSPLFVPFQIKNSSPKQSTREISLDFCVQNPPLGTEIWHKIKFIKAVCTWCLCECKAPSRSSLYERVPEEQNSEGTVSAHVLVLGVMKMCCVYLIKIAAKWKIFLKLHAQQQMSLQFLAGLPEKDLLHCKK